MEQLKVEDCLLSIGRKRLSQGAIQKSRIGVQLQRFTEKCEQSSLLSGLAAKAKETLKKMKEGVLSDCFGVGGEEPCETAKIPENRVPAAAESEKLPDLPEPPKREVSTPTTKAEPVKVPDLVKDQPRDPSLMAKVCEELLNHIENVRL